MLSPLHTPLLNPAFGWHIRRRPPPSHTHTGVDSTAAARLIHTTTTTFRMHILATLLSESPSAFPSLYILSRSLSLCSHDFVSTISSMYHPPPLKSTPDPSSPQRKKTVPLYQKQQQKPPPNSKPITKNLNRTIHSNTLHLSLLFFFSFCFYRKLAKEPPFDFLKLFLKKSLCYHFYSLNLSLSLSLSSPSIISRLF